jgi:hypothetical protein
MKIIIFLLMFFSIAALLIISNNGLALYSHENRVVFAEMYSDWFNDVYSNSIGRTGYIVRLDWLPKDNI